MVYSLDRDEEEEEEMGGSVPRADADHPINKGPAKSFASAKRKEEEKKIKHNTAAP